MKPEIKAVLEEATQVQIVGYCTTYNGIPIKDSRGRFVYNAKSTSTRHAKETLSDALLSVMYERETIGNRYDRMYKHIESGEIKPHYIVYTEIEAILKDLFKQKILQTVEFVY